MTRDIDQDYWLISHVPLFGLNEGQRYETSKRIEEDIEKRGGNVEAAKFFNVKSEGSRKLQVS